jgi:hypothetical protein
VAQPRDLPAGLRRRPGSGLRERLGSEGRARAPALYGWDSVAATAEAIYAAAAAARQTRGSDLDAQGNRSAPALAPAAAHIAARVFTSLKQ